MGGRHIRRAERAVVTEGRDGRGASSDGGTAPAKQVLTDGGQVTASGEGAGAADVSDDEGAAGDPLGDPERLAAALAAGSDAAHDVARSVGERTVNVSAELDEDAFFTGHTGDPTVVDRYDLEKAVPESRKRHFREVNRYWVNKPFAFVIVFHSERENEKKYFVVEPHLTETEGDLREFLVEKLTNSIKYSWDTGDDDSSAARARVIERETHDLLSRYNIYERSGAESGSGITATLATWLGLAGGRDEGPSTDTDRAGGALSVYPSVETVGRLEGHVARPEASVLPDGTTELSEYQVEKLLYYLRRNFVGYGPIDPIKHDVNVEDISCDGYDSPVFVYHSDYEQLITNRSHGREELDDFVVKLAQRSGKGISKRQPQVDATLPDGSRAQLTLGHEVSDRGTNYTIRQFKDVPYTPVDLVNWNTYSLDQVALLWLCIENGKSMLFAGGTASGKTTSLNALSLFIPSTAKIVSIEDTREVELPQRNWVASVTRPSFGADEQGDIDEYDLLEAALRQRPDYIVMGEVRGEEGRTLFQMISTGHTGYTTFHADSVGEVIDRFTTEPINVSKSQFTAVDLISIQSATRVRGRKVRRNRTLTEINHYDAELGEINVQDIYRWRPDEDAFTRMVNPSILQEIKFDRGWSTTELHRELFRRKVVLAYLVDRHITTYAEVAAAIQGFISDPETILGLLAQERLEETLADFRAMENVTIDINPEKEEMVPRPDPAETTLEQARDVLAEARDGFFEQFEDASVDDVESTFQFPTAGTYDWNTGEVTPDDARATPEPRAGRDEGTGESTGESMANGGRPEGGRLDGAREQDTGFTFGDDRTEER